MNSITTRRNALKSCILGAVALLFGKRIAKAAMAGIPAGIPSGEFSKGELCEFFENRRRRQYHQYVDNATVYHGSDRSEPDHHAILIFDRTKDCCVVALRLKPSILPLNYLPKCDYCETPMRGPMFVVKRRSAGWSSLTQPRYCSTACLGIAQHLLE